MKTSREAMDWFILIGEILVGICIVRSLLGVLFNLATNRGIVMLADIIAVVAEIAVIILVMFYFKQEEMYELPAIAMVVYMGTNLLRIFGSSWSYVFFVIPLGLMIATICMRWNVLGILAGVAMVFVNMIVAVIGFYTGLIQIYFSAYFFSNLVNVNSLMGIACILFYLVVKDNASGGQISSGSGSFSSSSGTGMPW